MSITGLVACANAVDDAGVDPLADPAAGSQDEKAIVGGSVTSIAQHPWQISLQTPDGFHFCGGSIIAADWILTAQHCMEGATASSLRVVAGVTKLSQAAASGQTKRVDRIVKNPGFTSPEHGHDVTLLHLSTPLSFNANVQPISLADADDVAAGATDAGDTATVSGWGTLSSGAQSTPDDLRAVNVPIISNTTAQQRYAQENLTPDQLAAGSSGKDSCQGDSGGPLTVSSNRGVILAGVVSWGYGCGDAQYPGMYARVSSFTSWIEQQTGALGGGSGGGGGGGGTTMTTVTLVDESGISLAQGAFQHFSVTVPAGATSLDVSITGSSGDADLYVRRGSQPTLAAYDCRPYTNGSSEDCALPSPAAGTWYASVNGYTAVSGVHLVVKATVPAGSSTGGGGGGGGGGAVRAADDFSSSSWSGGTGFTAAWTHTGDAVVSSGAARLRSSTGDIRRSVDVAGGAAPILSFNARVQGFESGDQAYVKVSADGGAYQTLQTFTSADGDDTYHAYDLDLSAFAGAQRITIRFDAQMSSASDTIFIDDIEVR